MNKSLLAFQHALRMQIDGQTRDYYSEEGSLLTRLLRDSLGGCSLTSAVVFLGGLSRKEALTPRRKKSGFPLFENASCKGKGPITSLAQIPPYQLAPTLTFMFVSRLFVCVFRSQWYFPMPNYWSSVPWQVRSTINPSSSTIVSSRSFGASKWKSKDFVTVFKILFESKR